jgi:uncharacterized membrane protein YphA (DoxX/SURF4 family)
VKHSVDPRLIAVMRVALGVLFIMAALPKIMNPHAFAKAVSNYHMLPFVAERALALLLPPLELLAGVCLVVGAFDAGAALLTFVLMIVFTVAVGTALARGLDISCGCFETEGGTKVGLRKIVANLALTLAALLVWRGDRSRFSLGSWVKRTGDIE